MSEPSSPSQWALKEARDFLGDQPYALLIALAERFDAARAEAWEDGYGAGWRDGDGHGKDAERERHNALKPVICPACSRVGDPKTIVAQCEHSGTGPTIKCALRGKSEERTT